MTLDATFWVTISFLIFLAILIYFRIPKKVKEVLEQNISNKRYQKLLMLANTNQPLEEGATEEERKFYEEAKNSYKKMIDNAKKLGIKNPVQYIPMEID